MSRRPTVPGIVTPADARWFFQVPFSIASLCGFGAQGLAEAIQRPGFLPRGFGQGARRGLIDDLTTLAPLLFLAADGEPTGLDRAARLFRWLEMRRQAGAEIYHGVKDRRVLPHAGWLFDQYGFPILAKQPAPPEVE